MYPLFYKDNMHKVNKPVPLVKKNIMFIGWKKIVLFYFIVVLTPSFKIYVVAYFLINYNK